MVSRYFFLSWNKNKILFNTLDRFSKRLWVYEDTQRFASKRNAISFDLCWWKKMVLTDTFVNRGSVTCELTYAIDHLATNTGRAKNTTFWWFIIVQPVMYLIWDCQSFHSKHYFWNKDKLNISLCLQLNGQSVYFNNTNEINQLLTDLSLAANLADIEKRESQQLRSL